MGYLSDLEKLIAQSIGEEERKMQHNPWSADRPGRLGIVDGQLKMEEPQGKGAWPVIMPSEGVNIFHMKQRITRATVVENVAEILMSVDTKEPQSEFEIVVSSDKMEVVLKVRFSLGIEYRICDSDFTQKLKVRTEPVREIPPEPIDAGLVISELKERKIRGNIQYDEIAKACQELKDVDVVILQGQPARPPIDGRVEMMCELTPKTSVTLEGDRVDHRNRQTIYSVEAGDVLAYWHPPQPGILGRDVYGEVVMPPSPRNARFRAGRGVRLISGGQIAVAERSGRPVFRNGTLSVEPQMIVRQDVDMTTGNIKFKGDVIVLGNVCESMKIEAGGLVEVKGSVYHANIVSGSHVTINHKLIGGYVIAGVQHAGLAKSSALIRQVVPELTKLISACRQLKNHPQFSVKDLSHRGDGYLIKLMLEMRFAHIPKTFVRLKDLLPNEDFDKQDGDLSDIVKELRSTIQHFVDSGPFNIQSLEELENDYAHLRDLGFRLEELLNNPANITVNYCQNAKVEATGNISVTGALAYDCDMVAGDKIHIAGDCRCGSYDAKSAIYAGSVGSKGMGITHMAVTEGGSISAKTFYPGVRLKIGTGQRITTTVDHNQTFSARDGMFTNRSIR